MLPTGSPRYCSAELPTELSQGYWKSMHATSGGPQAVGLYTFTRPLLLLSGGPASARVPTLTSPRFRLLPASILVQPELTSRYH